MNKKLILQESEASKPLGLKDGGHIIVKCSACNKPLMDCWITNAKEKFEWKVKATCPYCGDHSFEYFVKGRFAYGPIFKDEDHPITVIHDQTPGDGVTIFDVRLVK